MNDITLFAIRIAITLVYAAVWFAIVKSKGKTLWQSIEGEDHILQVSEFIVLVGIVGYIFMIPADAFLGIVASDKLWYGIDLIIAIALGTTAYLKKQK